MIPTVGLATSPMTKTKMLNFDALQKLLRRMVGWVRFADEIWQTTMRRMVANQMYPLKQWNYILDLLKFRLATRIGSRAEHIWPQLVARWNLQQQWQINFETNPVVGKAVLK